MSTREAYEIVDNSGYYDDMHAYDVVDSIGTELATQWTCGFDVPKGTDEILAACVAEVVAAFGLPKQDLDYFSLIVGAVWHNATLKAVGEKRPASLED